MPIAPRIAILVAGSAVLFASTAKAGAAEPYQHFWSAPDLKPPVVHILRRARATAPGYLFIAPKRRTLQAGPMIFDDRGRLVWFRPLRTRGVTDFRVQRLHGRPVLTWWHARPSGARSGDPAYTIADTSYRTIATIRPGNGLVGDIHEFLLTRRGTALMTTFRSVLAGDRRYSEGGVQELDIATGRVLFDWHSIDHVPPRESYSKPPRNPSFSFDYFHINSVAVDRDGNFLVSARNTHTVYKISRKSGKILWRLGGKHSDYKLGKGVRFAWQHDARRERDGTIRIFDNGAAPRVHDQSRVILVHLNARTMRARLVRKIVHHPALLAINQGNAQRLPDGHLLVGWGHTPYVTEYDEHGRMLLDLRFGNGADSYRAFRFRWSGRPISRPSVALHRGRVFFSWNGATNVNWWQILGGGDPRRLQIVRTVRKRGFETSAPAPRTPWIAVRALDRHGRNLRLSKPLRSALADVQGRRRP
jgi:Arylsulfotransferase (ASST)